MSRLRLALLGTGALVAAFATTATADPLSLHVSVGLWDMTNAAEMSGMENMIGMDPATMAQMPPASRARMQAAMAALNGVHTTTVKTLRDAEGSRPPLQAQHGRGRSHLQIRRPESLDDGRKRPRHLHRQTQYGWVIPRDGAEAHPR